MSNMNMFFFLNLINTGIFSIDQYWNFSQFDQYKHSSQFDECSIGFNSTDIDHLRMAGVNTWKSFSALHTKRNKRQTVTFPILKTNFELFLSSSFE